MREKRKIFHYLLFFLHPPHLPLDNHLSLNHDKNNKKAVDDKHNWAANECGAKKGRMKMRERERETFVHVWNCFTTCFIHCKYNCCCCCCLLLLLKTYFYRFAVAHEKSSFLTHMWTSSFVSLAISLNIPLWIFHFPLTLSLSRVCVRRVEKRKEGKKKEKKFASFFH